MDEKSTILIVEDEEINREILKFMLQDQFNIIEAVNGEDGLNAKTFLKLRNCCSIAGFGYARDRWLLFFG